MWAGPLHPWVLPLSSCGARASLRTSQPPPIAGQGFCSGTPESGKRTAKAQSGASRSGNSAPTGAEGFHQRDLTGVVLEDESASAYAGWECHPGKRAQHKPRYGLESPETSQHRGSPRIEHQRMSGSRSTEGLSDSSSRLREGPSLGAVCPKPRGKPKSSALTMPSAGVCGSHLPGGQRRGAPSGTEASHPGTPTRAGLSRAAALGVFRRCQGRRAPQTLRE